MRSYRKMTVAALQVEKKVQLHEMKYQEDKAVPLESHRENVRPGV